MAEPAYTTEPIAPPASQIGMEADEWDNDSAFGDEDGNVESTASITSSILKYRVENGRTYHAYKDGIYSFPNDERENDRLDLQHALCSLTIGGLYTAPIPPEQQLHRVLDVGTGTGIWAIDFADTHPASEVIGVDLSPTQPSFVSPNLSFEIDDLEDTWTFTKPFDFIFGRMTVGAFADSSKFFKQAYEHLTPGGWVEALDICNPVKSDDGTLPDDCELSKWSQFMLEGCRKIGRSAESPRLYGNQLKELGYINVREYVYKWPINRWPKDKKYKELGSWALANVEPNLEGLSLALFTRVLGWTQEELLLFLTGVRKDLKNPRYHGYWEIYSVVGQKPPSTAAESEIEVEVTAS